MADSLSLARSVGRSPPAAAAAAAAAASRAFTLRFSSENALTDWRTTDREQVVSPAVPTALRRALSLSLLRSAPKAFIDSYRLSHD